MGFILGLLALVPFLSLVPIHWYWRTGERCCLHKATWLSFSGSGLWGLLGAYTCALRPGWAWFFYALLVGGALFSAGCVLTACRHRRRKSKAALALLTFVMVFLAAERGIPRASWAELAGDNRTSVDLRLRLR